MWVVREHLFGVGVGFESGLPALIGNVGGETPSTIL